MELRTEIVRNEERGLVVRVDVHCPLNAQLPEQLRNRVIPRCEFYILGISIIAKQTGIGFTLSTRGSLPRRDDERLRRVVCGMRDKALEIYAEMLRLFKLSADMEALTDMGLGPTLVTATIGEVIALKDQVRNLEDLAQDIAVEDLEPPYDPLDEDEDEGGDAVEPIEPDDSIPKPFVVIEAASDDSLEFRLMCLLNRLGQTALYVTVIGLVAIAILNVAGVI